MNTITVTIRDTDGKVLADMTTTDPAEADAGTKRVLAWYPNAKVERTETEVQW